MTTSITHPIAHICLVSDQPLPNILPALIPEIKPKLIVLLVSSRMEQKASFLSDGFKGLGIATQIIKIADTALENIEALNILIDETIARFNSEYHLILNATGGTKILSIATFLSGFNCDLDVIYFDKNRVISLNGTNRDEPLELKTALSFEIFLKVHGIEISQKEHKKIPQKLADLMQKWVARVDDEEVIGRLNYLAAKTENKEPYRAQLNKDERHDEKLKMYLSELEQIGLVNILNNYEAVEFINATNRFFINGGWLEEFVFDRLVALQKDYPQINYVARSVTVKYKYDAPEFADDDSKTKNELDVMALINNQLWVFEVKTKDMKQSNSDTAENPTQTMLYKLAGIIYRLGGQNTRGVVISFRRIGPYDKDRAKILKLGMLEGKDMSSLKNKLKDLMNLKKN